MTGRGLDPARLTVFNNELSSVADEMGEALRRSAYSPNIKERRDYSCAVFNVDGDMIAQSAHIPVHLGSMPMSVKAVIDAMDLAPGDTAVLNDPFKGGTHLPDITMVSPVFRDGSLLGFVANRAHHSDVGGLSAGSMPLSSDLHQEGLVIPPSKLFDGGRRNECLMAMILANTRSPAEREGDLSAQAAANRRGVGRLLALIGRRGEDAFHRYSGGLLDYAERMTRGLISELPDGRHEAEDWLDDDGIEDRFIRIRVAVTISGDRAELDFSGSSAQTRGGVNATLAIAVSAAQYVFRALVGKDIPTNSGCLRPIKVIAPEGSVVNALAPGAVAGGNVETSQRIVDVIFAALARACPHKVPASSQGTMNNLSIGGWDPETRRAWAYYETLGGGMGARPGKNGADAIHTHMTNTLNTPVEALEFAYPLRARRYAIRDGSGGPGQFNGGDGLVRELELLEPARVTILSDRRKIPPPGLAEGSPGRPGRNVLLRENTEIDLPGKVAIDARKGDVISVRTPGGGGLGKREPGGE